MIGNREEEESTGEVIFHARVAAIQRGPLWWPAMPAKVLNLYPSHNIKGKEIINTVKVIIGESSSVIM